MVDGNPQTPQLDSVALDAHEKVSQEVVDDASLEQSFLIGQSAEQNRSPIGCEQEREDRCSNQGAEELLGPPVMDKLAMK
jgi:hypothetical protein